MIVMAGEKAIAHVAKNGDIYLTDTGITLVTLGVACAMATLIVATIIGCLHD